MEHATTKLPVTDLVRQHIEPVPGYAPGASELTDGRAIRLDWNESPFGLSPRAQQVLADFHHPNRYPDFAQVKLKRAMASYIGVSSDRIGPGAGLDDVFDTLATMLLEPGDEVVISDPTFGVYRSLFSLHGAAIVNVPLGPAPDFALNVDGIIDAVTGRTKLVIICNPNNPTGHLFSQGDIERIVESAACIVGIDEAYAEFSRIDHLDLANRYPNVVLFRTLSKFAGLASFRVGYGIYSEPLVPYLNRAIPPFCNISALGAEIACAALADVDVLRGNVARILDERERLAGRLREIEGVHVFSSATNFLLFALPVDDSTEIHKQLAERNVFVRRFGKPEFDLQHCLRVTIGTPDENDTFADALSKILCNQAS